MLYEFAITPEVLTASLLDDDPTAYANLIHLLKSLPLNGLLANLDKERWRKDVEANLAVLPAGTRDRVKAYFNQLYDLHRFARHNIAQTHPSSEQAWLIWP